MLITMASPDTPRGSGATVHVLNHGYVGPRTASTVGYVVDGPLRLVVDPGMVADRTTAILAPLSEAGGDAATVTDVVFSHHHPDHTLNAALFRHARFHDHWAIYLNDEWTDRDAEGFELSESVRLIRTPFALDAAALHEGRERVLAVADLIVPGHGTPFEPGPGTPR
jgi:glyoxylase-like metal-dependent hydrolase (beta-lactamase superfamily II)